MGCLRSTAASNHVTCSTLTLAASSQVTGIFVPHAGVLHAVVTAVSHPLTAPIPTRTAPPPPRLPDRQPSGPSAAATDSSPGGVSASRMQGRGVGVAAGDDGPWVGEWDGDETAVGVEEGGGDGLEGTLEYEGAVAGDGEGADAGLAHAGTGAVAQGGGPSGTPAFKEAHDHDSDQDPSGRLRAPWRGAGLGLRKHWEAHWARSGYLAALRAAAADVMAGRPLGHLLSGSPPPALLPPHSTGLAPSGAEAKG